MSRNSAEEWDERGSTEWQRRGAQTPSGELAAAALCALQEFDAAPDAIIARLQTLLRQLHRRDRGRALAGYNGQLTARALHALDRPAFPEAQFSATNHLLNPSDCGV